MRKHGTVSCYVGGCRLPECVAARREYDRKRWAAIRESGQRRHFQRGPRARVGEASALSLRVAELRYDFGFTLTEIAAELGLSGTPSVSYHLGRHAKVTQLPDPPFPVGEAA